jgi:hypothetical protein
MRQPRILVLGILAALLSGCVTAGHPKSANTTTAESALLRGHMADRLRFYTHGEPNVNIAAIDNRGTPAFSTNFHVPSGKHLVTVYVFAFPFANATATVALEFQAGKKYRLTAQKASGAFDLMFWDESEGTEKRTLLTTSRIGGKYASSATFNSAILHGSRTNALGYGPWGEPFVRITAVDSQTIHAGWGRTPDIHVAAGRRLVTVELRRPGWRATGTVELEFQAGKTYGLTAREMNHDFDLMFWMESPGTETRALLTTTRLRGWTDIFDGALLVFLLTR